MMCSANRLRLGLVLAAFAHRHGEAALANATLADLHCCSVSGENVLLMACEDDLDDSIAGISYAFSGNSSDGSAVCGREIDAVCGMNVQEAIRNKCVGLRRCPLKVEDFAAESCPNATTQELRVRWTCFSDVRQQERAQKQLPQRLPDKPLRAQGSVIVDAFGERVRFTGVTWGGLHINNVLSGLDVAPASSIAKLIRRLGFNFVRLTFSAEAVLQNPVVEDRRVAANPQLLGRRALDVIDAGVAALEQEGVMVWLDNHMPESGWCCDGHDGNGLWFNGRYTAEDWIQMWQIVTQRYGGRPNVVGVGLKNEPRPACSGQHGSLAYNFSELFELAGGNDAPDPHGMKSQGSECVWPQWSSGPQKLQFKLAMERAGKAILNLNPDLLIGVSGLYYSQFLNAVAENPVDLPRERLVYEAHEYYWWRDHAPGGNFDVDIDPEGALNNYTMALDENWGYLLRNGIAPVLVSEFGMSHTWTKEANVLQWFKLWEAYAQGEQGPLAVHGGVDWAYWQLSGVQEGGIGRHEGQEESFGVLNQCWTAPWNDDHFEAIQGLGLTTRRRMDETEVFLSGVGSLFLSRFAIVGVVVALQAGWV